MIEQELPPGPLLLILLVVAIIIGVLSGLMNEAMLTVGMK